MHLTDVLCRYFIAAFHSVTGQGVYRDYVQHLSTVFVSLTMHNEVPNFTKASVSSLQNATSLCGTYVVTCFLI